MRSDILVKNVDIELLRTQRDYLLTTYGDSKEELAGIINLLDYMLDVAEGFE